ncbi:glycosyltransferase family 4 protein [Priestia megaterium]|uniref:glycosyltransferase family 4 protein n=1 Tax=Priestia megaterium TaxID=1404 RepID=UPI002E205EFC|nr:glycosyltransferase family 4 protein [Priestia megaterium]
MEKKLKILHLNTGLVAGGAERLISDMLPVMKEQGHQVDLLILEDKQNNIFEQELKTNDIKIVKAKYNKKFSLKNFLFVRKYIREYDIVHSHVFPIQYWVLLATLGLKKKPILFTTEHNTFNRRRKYKLLQKVEKFIYSRYDHIISISDETQQNLLEWLNRNKSSKFSVIQNGVNLNKFKNSDRINLHDLLEIKYDSKNKFLLMVARFDEQKDHLTVLKSLLELPQNIKMIFVGEGKLQDTYEDMVKQYKLESRVFFMGKRTDVHKITKSVDVCILSSIWEGFGLVAIEGMAAGKPVIVSKVPGLENVVGNAGLLFEKGNSGDLATLIREILNDSKLYEKFGLKGIKHAEQYSIENMVSEYIKFYYKYKNE